MIGPLGIGEFSAGKILIDLPKLGEVIVFIDHEAFRGIIPKLAQRLQPVRASNKDHPSIRAFRPAHDRDRRLKTNLADRSLQPFNVLRIDGAAMSPHLYPIQHEPGGTHD